MKKEFTSSQKNRVKPGGFIGETSVLNRWGISALEACLCAVVFIGCILVHFVPIYTQLCLPIEEGLSLISFATPVSGMLYLSAAQVIPDPPGFPLSSAEMALTGFFLWQVATGKILDVFRLGRPLWMAVAPFFVWTAGLSLVRGNYNFVALLFFAILTGCAAAALVGQSGNRLVTCLVMFIAGQALAMCLFWILKLHLGTPVQIFEIDIYGDAMEEGARIGTAKGNAAMLGMPMGLVCFASIGWFSSRPKQNWLAGLIALACLAAAAPPLIGSGSRSGIVVLAGGVAFLLVGGILTGRSFIRTLVMLAGITVVLFFGWHRLGLDERWQEMKARQEDQQAVRGSIYAGRMIPWEAAWRDILDSPMVGGSQMKHLSNNTWDASLSHSTYLDAGLVGGFPGMALFGWLVLKPILELWRRRREAVLGWLLGVYVVSAISIGSSSAMQSKHFWMLWGMAAACFLPAVARIKTRGSREARRAKSRGQRAQGEEMMPEDRSQISDIRDQRSVGSGP
jgi:hypothetical protein